MKTVAEVMRLKDTHSTYRQTHPRKRSAHLSRGNSTLKRYTLTHVYCSTVYRSHDVEATYVSINRWMDKENMVHIHSGILLGHKKDEIIPFAITWMDLHLIMLSEVRQRKTNTIWYHLYVESKIWYKWTYPQNRNRLMGIENRLMVAKGWEREGLELWD